MAQLEHDDAHEEHVEQQVHVGDGELQYLVVVLGASLDDAHRVEEPVGEGQYAQEEHEEHTQVVGARQRGVRSSRQYRPGAKEQDEELERDSFVRVGLYCFIIPENEILVYKKCN